MHQRLLALFLTVLTLAACSQIVPEPAPQSGASLRVSAVPTFTYVKSLTGSGFHDPMASALHPDGSVYVVMNDGSLEGSSVLVITPEGRRMEMAWAGFGLEQVYRPFGIDIAASGNAFVADFGNERILTTTALGGNFDYEFATGRYTGVAVDADGMVYAVGREPFVSEPKVFKFANDGRLLRSWDGSDSTMNALSYTTFGIAVDNQRVYVTDADNRAVYVFDKDGHTRAVWQKTDDADGLIRPSTIALDDTYAYVSSGYQIVVFDKQGNFVTKFGSKGTGEDQFQSVNGLDVAKGQLYVSDTYANAVKIYDIAEQSEPIADTYRIDLEKAPVNKVFQNLKVGQGVTYYGTGAANQSAIRVDGFRYQNGKKLSGNQVKVIDISGNKVLVVAKAGTNIPNPTGGELDIKPTQGFGGPSRGKNGLVTLKSLTVNGVSTSGAKLIVTGNGKPIRTLPLSKTPTQTLTFDEPNVGFIQVRANDSFTVDDVVFEVATPR